MIMYFKTDFDKYFINGTKTLKLCVSYYMLAVKCICKLQNVLMLYS